MNYKLLFESIVETWIFIIVSIVFFVLPMGGIGYFVWRLFS